MNIGSRRGYALIEMAAVISLSTVLLGMAVGLLHVLFQADRSARAQLAHHATLSRLAEQFRRDVHEADAITKTGDADTWRLARADNPPVLYRLTDSTIERVEETGKDRPQNRETFPLPRDITPTIQTSPGSPTVVALILTPREQPPPAAGPAPLSMRLEAILARDHHHLKKP